MIKKIVVSAVAMIAFSSVCMAEDYSLKANMHQLNTHMIAMQEAFISGDKKAALAAAKALGAESKLMLSEDVIKSMLPKEKQHKARIGHTSAIMISDAVATMQESMDNTLRDTTQNAYLDIQRACMRCHNLVRDW